MLFRVVLTMTSVGYLTVESDPNEKILMICIMFFTGITISYLIEGIKQAISKSTEQADYYRGIILKLKYYFTNNKIPVELKSRVIRYIDYLQQINNENILDESDILQSLSLPLKEEILLKTRGYFLFNSAPFRNFSHNFLRYLVHFLDIQVFAPEDLIIKEGEYTKSLYWIMNGSVEIFDQHTNTTFRELFKGKYFGELGFFLKRKRCASARACTYTELFELKHFKFSEITESRTCERETAQLLASSCQHDLSPLGVRCYFCSDMGHVAKDCKKYVYIVDHDSIIKKADYRKYKISKRVENLSFGKDIKKQLIQIQRLKRMDGKCVSGKKEFEDLYRNRTSLSHKAKIYQMNSSKLTNSSNLALIHEEIGGSGTEDETINNLLPEFFQFKKNFVTSLKRKHLDSTDENSDFTKLITDEAFTFGEKY